MAMKVALTGATGFIGSHVLTELRDNGHEVTALVRDAAGAGTGGARGAGPAAGPPRRAAGAAAGGPRGAVRACATRCAERAVAKLLSNADGAIHVASPGDATSADLD